MRLTVFFLAVMGSAEAFVNSPSFITRDPSLTMSSVTHMDKTYTVGSGMTEHDIQFFIEKMSPENFEETLEMLEPLLTNECVGDICEDYVGQLQDKAASIGKKVPDNYAPTHH